MKGGLFRNERWRSTLGLEFLVHFLFVFKLDRSQRNDLFAVHGMPVKAIVECRIAPTEKCPVHIT
jgi:hypothetical protein